MRKKISLVLVCLLFFLTVKTVKAPLVPHDYTLDIPCFSPTKITFNFPYTHNHSLTDISTIGQSLYKHSGGPNFYEFLAEDIDTYRFTIHLHYETFTNESILIGLWSGNQGVQGFTLCSHFEDVVIHVTLSVTKEPSYPSDEEVAGAVTAQIAKDLADTYNALNDAINRQNASVMTNSIISMVSMIGVIVLSVAYYLEVRRSKTVSMKR